MRLKLLLLVMIVNITVLAQRNMSFSERIRTVESVVNGDRQKPAVISLNGNDVVTVSFDDMTHDYVRYVYKLEHCDKEWNVSDGLFESDYMTGTNLDKPIEDYVQSMNTSNLYTHYKINFPNQNVELLLSGNYKVSIYDEEDLDNPVACACFSVADKKIGIAATVSTNTDIDYNKAHQQIELALNLNKVELRDPAREVYVRILQNKRYDNAVSNPAPTFVSDREMKWQHCKELIFPAGNEFRKFEILDVHQPTLGVEKIRWFAPFYHAFLYPGKPFENYIYNKEVNGSYVIRNRNDVDCDTESEYVIVHFALEADKKNNNGEYYVCGQWNSYVFSPENKMKYDSQNGVYDASILLKQGYYNYSYLFVPKGEKKGLTSESEGDFFQTENEYTVYVYAHLQGERYDRLLGYRDFRFVPNK